MPSTGGREHFRKVFSHFLQFSGKYVRQKSTGNAHIRKQTFASLLAFVNLVENSFLA